MKSKPESPLVSIIIPCYNGGAFINEAISSILAQTYTNWELIIIDDGSTDNSKEIITSRLDNKKIRLLENKRNLGIARTKNKGVRNSKGEFLAFLDQDDVWAEDKLRLQAARLKADPDLAIVCTGMFFTDPALNKTSVFTGYDDTNQERALKELYITPINSSSIMMIRRSALESDAPFNENLRGWDDYELLMRLAVRYKIGYIKEPLVKKRIHAGGAQRLTEVTREEEMVFKDVLDLHPFLRQYKKERDAAFFLGRATEYLQSGDLRAARRLAGKRLGIRPLSPASWMLFFVTLLPAPIATLAIKIILVIAGKTKLFTVNH